MELKPPHPRTRVSVSLYALVPVPLLAMLSVMLFRWPFIPRPAGILFTVLWVTTLLGLLGVYLPLRYRRARFCVEADRVTTVSGVYYLTTRQMPLAGIRHVTVIRGPLEHRWGFAFVVVSGAGGWLLLEGVEAAEAMTLSDRLTRRNSV